MKLYEELVLRLDEISVEEILSSDTLKLINKFNPEISSLNLKRIILDNLSPVQLLRNPKHRRHFIESLKDYEAKILLEILGFNYNGLSPYEELLRIKFKKNSKIEYMFFEYLGIQLNLYEEEEVEVSEFKEMVPSQYPLFLHQRNAIKEVKANFLDGTNRILLHMPTGSGKTRTSMNIICTSLREEEPGVIFWLASTEELCKQAADEFAKAWNCLGNRDVEVYRFWGDHDLNMEDVKDGLIVAGLPKIVSAVKKDDGIKFIANLANKSNLIIMDEAHQAIAPTYEMVIQALFNLGHNNQKKLLGLSATPGRTWNDVEEDTKLAEFFSRKKVTLKIEGYDNPVDYLVDQDYLAATNYKELNYYSDYDFSNELKQEDGDFSIRILKKLGEDLERNYKIINAAKSLINQHKRIIIFAPSVGSSDLISFVLQSIGIKAFSITGKTNSSERRANIKKYLSNEEEPLILVNYGVLTTGFDAPKTSAAIIARPTISLVLYSQMVGRAIRGGKAGGNKTAEIITVVDQSLPGFQSVSDAFKNWEDVWE
ncbi:DEAD/DEAH box helicase [Planococcus sp. X10-3]|uniref:DEAD/DEAH box helicase n=1 Tax=Planococcus sp. X10-3 TaxID=3061240 RepID=UPI003BB11D8B